MAENNFKKCEAPVGDAELDALADLAGYPLPADFRAHYQKRNGGVPERAWWDSLDEFPPCMVNEFYAVAKGRRTVESLLRKLRDKKLVPDHLLPFAVGQHANQYFCLDLKSGAVVHYLPDSFQPEREPEENYRKAQRKLSRSFNEFVKGLVGSDEIDAF